MRSEEFFVLRQKTYQLQAGENRVSKDDCVTLQTFIAQL